MDDKRSRLEAIGLALLKEIDDPTRPGLQDTPARWARMWIEFTEYEPGTTDTVFEYVTTDQMVIVSGMRVWSMCEHHLLPFWCTISVGYIATTRVLGLSKFARIAHQCAHRLQVQERLVSDIADAVQAITGTQDVAVLGKGEHLCMTMRGVRTEANMTTSVMRGVFFTKTEARSEFLSLIQNG